MDGIQRLSSHHRGRSAYRQIASYRGRTGGVCHVRSYWPVFIGLELNFPDFKFFGQVTIGAAPAGASITAPLTTWNTSAAIQYGTAVSSVQLDATASVPGTFAYSVPPGTVLKAGAQTLSALFTPSDTKTYSAATASVQVTVNPAISNHHSQPIYQHGFDQQWSEWSRKI